MRPAIDAYGSRLQRKINLGELFLASCVRFLIFLLPLYIKGSFLEGSWMKNQPVSQSDYFADKTEGSLPEPNPTWPPEAYELARQAKAANALKFEALIRRLQRKTGRRQRDCAQFLLRQIASTGRPQIWTGDEVDQVRNWHSL
jgi:hypothetical protein